MDGDGGGLGKVGLQDIEVALRMAERGFARLRTSVLDEVDLTEQQLSIMRVLADSPGITSTYLARLCTVTVTVVGQEVGLLAERGLIERVASPMYEGVWLTRLSSAGRTLVGTADDLLLAPSMRLARWIPEDEREHLIDLLARVVSAVHPHPAAQDA